MSPLPHSAGKFVQTGLLKGATHTIITDKFDPVKASNFIDKERITVTFMVPTMIYRLLDAIDKNNCDISANQVKIIAYACSSNTRRTIKART